MIEFCSWEHFQWLGSKSSAQEGKQEMRVLQEDFHQDCFVLSGRRGRRPLWWLAPTSWLLGGASSWRVQVACSGRRWTPTACTSTCSSEAPWWSAPASLGEWRRFWDLNTSAHWASCAQSRFQFLKVFLWEKTHCHFRLICPTGGLALKIPYAPIGIFDLTHCRLKNVFLAVGRIRLF